MFPPTDIQKGWGAHGTLGGPLASFFKRYYRPLVRYARYKFSLAEQDAEELASAFLARELEQESRARSLYQVYDPGKGRFRNLLSTSFYRFCRDRLKSRRHELSLDRPDLLPGDAAGHELGRLIARELLNAIRENMSEDLSGEERAVLALKWPVDIDRAPASDAEVQRALSLSRGRVRQILKRLTDRVTFSWKRLVREAGMSDDEARVLLSSCFRALEEERKRAEGRGRG